MCVYSFRIENLLQNVPYVLFVRLIVREMKMQLCDSFFICVCVWCAHVCVQMVFLNSRSRIVRIQFKLRTMIATARFELAVRHFDLIEMKSVLDIVNM